MKKRNKGGGGASWMDTYGDMVTLLLCFFVLLYSMSTISEDKWKALVQSFNPNAVPTMMDPQGNDGPSADEQMVEAGENLQLDKEKLEKEQEKIDASIEKLFRELKEYVTEAGLAESISVTKGDGYVFISFNDAVFFDGDSYELRRDGKDILDDVGTIIGRAGSAIDELRVLGHTAQAYVDRANNVTVDRFLASNRSTVVLVYLQQMGILAPARMISMGFGQWRPVAANDSAENRAKNRRAELIVTGKNVMDSMGDQIEQYYTQRGTESPLTVRSNAADGAALAG